MKTELLAPAGSMEALKAAVSAGADAVYLGGAAFGARAYAKNLDEQEILSAIDYVHLRNRKLYLTVNTLLKEEELEEKLYPYLRPCWRCLRRRTGCRAEAPRRAARPKCVWLVSCRCLLVRFCAQHTPAS